MFTRCAEFYASLTSDRRDGMEPWRTGKPKSSNQDKLSTKAPPCRRVAAERHNVGSHLLTRNPKLGSAGRWPAVFGGPPNTASNYFCPHRMARKKVGGTRFSAGRRKPHAGRVRSPFQLRFSGLKLTRPSRHRGRRSPCRSSPENIRSRPHRASPGRC